MAFQFGNDRSSHQRCSVKKALLKISQISQENICIGDSNIYYSCEIYEILKNTYFEEHLRTTASVIKP